MRNFVKTLALAGLLLLLQNCGNDGQKSFYGGIWQGAKERVPSQSKAAPAPEQTAASSAALLAEFKDPLIRATSLDLTTVLIRVSQNGGYDQWHSVSKVGFTFRDGILTATRGLGGDLMNADVEESTARLKTKSSQPAVRVHRYLSGENRIITRSFLCLIKDEGLENTPVAGKMLRLTRMSETCTNSDTEMENLYWIDPRDGFIWKSRQWVSTFIGSFVFERIVR